MRAYLEPFKKVLRLRSNRAVLDGAIVETKIGTTTPYVPISDEMHSELASEHELAVCAHVQVISTSAE